MDQIYKNVKYNFFWNGIFSNWYESYFDIDGITFNCGEQYMMYEKAITFDDAETARKILESDSPKEQKQLGRKVKNFNPEYWDNVKYEIVKRGLKEKFNQNPKLKKYLLSYKGYQMVEASPFDRIWGIGFTDKEAIENIDKWGDNLLGQIITELSNEL
jgi:hypothetical protein